MNLKIRPIRIPDDFGRVVDIYNTIMPEPHTVQQFIEWEQNAPASRIREWVVATVDDYVVANGGAERVPWMAPGVFSLHVRVDPDYRRQGAGQALLEHVEGWARAQGATLLRATVRDHMAESVAWAQARGYEIERHIFESTLDVPAFDEAARFPGVVERAEAEGFRFHTLAEMPGEATERMIYDCVSRSVIDIPGFDGEMDPFEEWKKSDLSGEGYREDCVIFALKDDRVAGVSYMRQVTQTRALWTWYTGVDPDFRGHNLSLALKLLCVRKAKELGAPYMRTNNDSQNGPMLAVNRKMGYVPCPGQYRVQKRV